MSRRRGGGGVPMTFPVGVRTRVGWPVGLPGGVRTRVGGPAGLPGGVRTRVGAPVAVTAIGTGTKTGNGVATGNGSTWGGVGSAKNGAAADSGGSPDAGGVPGVMRVGAGVKTGTAGTTKLTAGAIGAAGLGLSGKTTLAGNDGGLSMGVTVEGAAIGAGGVATIGAGAVAGALLTTVAPYVSSNRRSLGSTRSIGIVTAGGGVIFA